MPRLYTATNPSSIAYHLDGGGSGYEPLPYYYSTIESEYIAILYGLNSYFIKWNKELDSRQYDIDDKEEFYKVATPSQETPRPLPSPVLVLSSNETVVKQLSKQSVIDNARVSKLAKQVWQMTENVDVKYEYVGKKENTARRLLI